MRRMWIGWLVIVGLLAHAALLVRHNTAALQRGLAGVGASHADGGMSASGMTVAERAARADWISAGLPAADFASCHTANGGPSDPQSPPADNGPCSICLGLASAFALAPQATRAVQRTTVTVALRFHLWHDRASFDRHLVVPPARAPPPRLAT